MPGLHSDVESVTSIANRNRFDLVTCGNNPHPYNTANVLPSLLTALMRLNDFLCLPPRVTPQKVLPQPFALRSSGENTAFFVYQK
jgi:hypothetical protein